MKEIKQFLVFSVNSISQVAISEYLTLFPFRNQQYVSGKRDYFRHLLKTADLSSRLVKEPTSK
jgi:methionine aminotransferase